MPKRWQIMETEQSPTTICMINQKGGCGKSSMCFHLSGYFAQAGMSVLLVDADPQGSLSQGFFGSAYVETLEPHDTLTAAFDDRLYFHPGCTLPVATAFAGISIIPSNQSLAPCNRPSPETEGMAQYALRSCLEDLAGFDVVLVDCPPNLYLCSWNALLAADYVVVPVPPEDFGTQGLRVVHQAIENARQLNPRLQLLGHLITRSDRRLLVHRSYEQKLRSLYDDTVFDVVVPEASAFKVSLACRQPLPYFSAKSKPAQILHRLGQELLRRTGGIHQHQRVA